MLGELTPLEQTRAYQDIIARNRPIWIKEGRKEGCQEEANGLIRRQLARRLGSLSAAQEKGLEALTLTQLEALGEALLDFTDAADLDAWLDQELRRA